MHDDYKYKPRFVDIRIKPPGARRRADEPRRCDWADCSAPGVCRAPKGPDNLGEYYYFCPAHAAEYNRNWNFFAGMKDDEVAAFQRDAAHGHRPTWGIGAKGDERVRMRDHATKAKTGWRDTFSDPLGLFRDGPNAQSPTPEAKPKRGQLETQALATLGLGDEATMDDITTQYKSLIKKLHPDANGGDRSSEEQLRRVIRAYKILRKHLKD